MAELNIISDVAPDGTMDDILEITNCSESNYRLADVITMPGQYTFSVWVKSAVAIDVSFYILGNLYTENVQTEWSKVVFTVDESSTTYIDICPSSDDSLYLYKGMLQQGQFDTDWKPAPEDVDDEIQTVSGKLELKVGKDENDQIVSMLNASANEINISGDRLVIDSTNFKLSSDGTIIATSGMFSGEIEAETGLIGGWKLGSDKIYGGDADSGVAVMQRPSPDTTYVFAAGGTSHSSYIDCPFRVTKDGRMYAEKGVIGDWSIDAYKIYGGDADSGVAVMQRPNSNTTYVFAAGGTNHSNYADCPFRVDKKGNLYAAKTNISNDLTVSGLISSAGSVTSGNQIGFSSSYNESNVGLFCRWADGSNHNMIDRSNDGLTSGVGWKGSPDYKTVTNVRGQTVKVVNSSGTSTLSDERLKKDWTDLSKYKSFYNNLEPKAFKYINGSSGRFHIGYSAQSVEKALSASGLTNYDFGGIIKYHVDELSDDFHGYEEEYGLIYTEFVALNTYMIKDMMKEVSSLESELKELRDEIVRIKNGG